MWGYLSFWGVLSVLICIGLGRFFSIGKALLIWVALQAIFFVVITYQDGGRVTGWFVIFVQLPCFFIGLFGLPFGLSLRKKSNEKTAD